MPAKLAGISVTLIISAAFLLTAFPGLMSPAGANGLNAGQQPFPVGPLSPMPTFSTTTAEPQVITVSQEESHYCPTCTTYPALYGILNDFYEAKVQPNGAGVTWYVHFPTTGSCSSSNIVNSLCTTQSLDPTNTNLTVTLLNSNTKLPMADRRVLSYFFDQKTGYQEVDVFNLTATKKGSGPVMSFEYSSVVETGDIFQFIPFPNGALLDNGGQPTIHGDCYTGKPDCTYTEGYIFFGEASLTRTCTLSSTTVTTYSGTKTTTHTVPNGNCALGSTCAVHSTTTTIATSTTVVKSDTCTYSDSTLCTSTDTSITYTTSARLPGCDESDWTSASVLHSWGDANGYQQLDALENSWEIIGQTTSGAPGFAIKMADHTDEYGNRTQSGTLEWLDTYTQEPLGLNYAGTFYSINTTTSSNCKSFTFRIPTSRGVLSGSVTVTPYIGTGCPVTSNPNPYVGYLSGSFTLASSSGPVKYLVTGVALEFECIRGTSSDPILPDCTLPVPTSTTVSCSPVPISVGQQTTCTATVSNTVGSILPYGTIAFTTNSTGSFTPASAMCNLPPVVTTGQSAYCTIEFTPTSVGHTLVTAVYPGDNEFVHSGSSGQTLIQVT